MDNSFSIKQITIVPRPNLDKSSSLNNSSPKPKPKRKEMKMTEEEKEINRKILCNMKRKMDYAKNPRYENDGPVVSFSNLIYKDLKCKDNPFFVDPQEVVFSDYQTNCVYQIDLKVLNRTQLLTSFKYIPPLTENFTIKKIIYPKKDSALIAPGMYAKIEIYFHATSMENFQDEMTIITEKMAFKVPLKGIRDKPALSLANPMDCKKCFIGDRVEIHFRCKNNGGDAHFRFISEETMNNYDDPNMSANELLTVGPFNIFPQEFYLYKGMIQNITINFTPTEEGIIEKKLNLVCESSSLNYILRGEGIKVDIGIKSLDGLSIENENGQTEKLENLLFQDTYPHTSSERRMVLKNTSPVNVKFHWSIYDYHHQNDFSMSPEENFYFITPEDGTFEPDKEIEFKIRFTPLNSVIYEQKLDLVIEDVPFPAIKQFNSMSQTIKQSFTKAEPYLPGFNSPFPSYPLYSFHLKGRGKLPFLEVNKSYIDLGDVSINQEVSEFFTVSNPKTGIILFKLKKIMQTLLLPDPNIGNVNRFFKDNCFDEDIIFKKKINLIQKTTEIPVDLYDIDEYKTNLLLSDVDYLQLSTVIANDIESNSQTQIMVSNNESSLSKNVTKKRDTLQSKLFNEDIELMKNTLNQTNCLKKKKPLSFDQTLLIKQHNTIDFSITFKPDHIGIYKSSIVFQPDDGSSFAIDIKANIIGPTITINSPFVDFGLFAIGTVRSLSFQIENHTPIKARYLIKETRYVGISLSSSSSDLNSYKDEYEGEINAAIVQKRHKIQTLIDYDTQDMIKEDIMKTDSYVLKFSSVTGVLDSNEKKEVSIHFYSPYPTHVYNTIEVMVENSESVFFNYSAKCEMASAYIRNTLIHPKDIFLTMPIVANNNIITIVNPSNLPIHFKWDNIFEADHITAEFEPNKGIIEPHCEQNIQFKIVYFYIAVIDDLFKCYIEEMDIPLGVIVQGEVIGLDIGYEFTKETFEIFQSQVNINILAKGDLGLTSTFGTTRKRSAKDRELLAEKLKMNDINMKYLKVNTPSEITFKIKNLSGIPTTFDLAIQSYPPGKEKVIKIDKDQTSTNLSQLSKLSSVKTKKRQPFKIDHLLLSAAHEEINFTSAKGAEFTKMKQIANDSVLYLSNNKGVAIVVEPKKGALDPHSECVVKVSFFNECVGEFFDNLTSAIKGLPLKVFPINLRIKGNPLQLSPFQPGINYTIDPPLMKMGYVLRNVSHIEKHVKLHNIGANTIAINWKMYDYEAFLKPNYNVFDIKIQERTVGKFGLKFSALEPKEFTPEENCFTISPESAIINPKSTFDFLMTFKTSEEGQKSSLLVAYPSIVGDDEGRVSFNELSLKVIAHGLKPNLTVDKSLSVDNEYLYKFYVHSYGKSPKPMRPIILINKEKINMKIQLQIEGPFRIERSEPLEATIGKMMYNVIPNSNLKLDIKYLAPSPQNEKEWPMTLVNEKTGKLTLIFENNETEIYFLKGILKRPRICLSMTGNESVSSLNIIDFGYVNCDSQKIEYMHLMNETEVDTNWKINYVKFSRKGVYGHGTITREEKEDLSMEDNPDVFNFAISEGIIYGPSQMLINLPLGPALPQVSVLEEKKYKPMKIQVSFSPKKNIFYKCRYRITTSTGNNIDFILKGFGSYLEEHII